MGELDRYRVEAPGPCPPRLVDTDHLSWKFRWLTMVRHQTTVMIGLLEPLEDCGGEGRGGGGGRRVVPECFIFKRKDIRIS